MLYVSLKTQNGIFKRNVKVQQQIVFLSLKKTMMLLLQSQIHVSWVELEALLWLSFESYRISFSHAFLNFEFEVSRLHNYFFTPTNRTFLFTCMPASLALLTFHFHFFDRVFNFDFSHHLPRSSTYRTGVQSSRNIPTSFTMLTNLSSSETIDSLASLVKHW